jgi:pseudo-rSAM protein
MKNNLPGWLCIEPYVHISEQNSHVLFYNTLNRKILEYHDVPEITALAKELIDDSNGYVIRLTGNESNFKVIALFIRQLQRLHMGTLLSVSGSSVKPVNILPQPAFRQRLKAYEKGIERPGIRAENFLHTVSLHLNAGETPFTAAFPGAFLQFPSPCGTDRFGKEMDMESISKLMAGLSHISPLAINILGSDPSAYPGWDELTADLSKTNFKVKYHFTLPQAEVANLEATGPKSVLSLLVTFPFYEENLATIEKLERTISKKSRLEYNFIVQDLSDLDKAQQLIAHFNIRHWFFKPYYSGTNLSFFEDNVYITAEDIALSKPDQKQIFSRITFNENDFGKFTIMPDGTIFANVNDPALGNLQKMGIISMIEAEMDYGKSWTRVRARVSPCNSCIYNFLCPPVSNYEILLSKYNFCHIYKEESL